jgi:hypothetical protein
MAEKTRVTFDLETSIYNRMLEEALRTKLEGKRESHGKIITQALRVELDRREAERKRPE